MSSVVLGSPRLLAATAAAATTTLSRTFRIADKRRCCLSTDSISNKASDWNSNNRKNGGGAAHNNNNTPSRPRTTTNHGPSPVLAATTTTTTKGSSGASVQEELLDDLCRKHMDLPAQDFAMGCGFLHQVALGVPTPEIERLLREVPSLVNFRDYDRRTPLHIAASEGHLGICRLLLWKGAMINRSDRWGLAPLDDAHRHGHSEIVTFLQNNGGKFGSSSLSINLMSACVEGDVEEVESLLEYGNIDLNSSGDYDRRTPLHVASSEGHSTIVELLCRRGAKVNAKDRWGSHPIDGAILANHNDCVRLLESFDAERGSSSVSSFGQEAILDLIHTYGKTRENGVLSMDWHDVQDMLIGIGEEPTETVVKKLFEVADVDRNGTITTEEFLKHHETFLGGRPARIILVVGGPGSGKGVLCERLAKECGVVHLSSGELLRDEIDQGTELGKQVEEIVENGELVSSAIMVTLMQKRMKDHPGKRILLDGFPRSQENAKDLVTLCGQPELALHLSCDDTVLLERIMKRGLSGDRSDDNFQTGIQRIRNYHKYHNTTLEFLREAHVPVVYLDCSTTPEGVWDQLRSIGRLMRSSVRF